MPEPIQIIWWDEPGGNVEHLFEHGVSPDEAEDVRARYFDDREPSRARPDRFVVQGHTSSGRFLVVVFDYQPDEEIVIPITDLDLES